jgi:hypothetical protein
VALGLALALGCSSGKLDNGPGPVPVPVHGWVGQASLETSTLLDSGDPSAAQDGSGNAFVAWDLDRGGTHELWGKPFHANGGWQYEGLLTSLWGSSRNPRVAVGGTGTFMVAWDLAGSATDSAIYVTRYTPSAGLGTALRLNTGYGYSPAIAMNASGGACVAWMEKGTTRPTIKAARYSASGGSWTTPESVSAATGADALWPTVAMDAAGNAAVVWAQAVDASTGPFSIWMSVFRAGQGWTLPFSPQVGTGPADPYFALAMSAAGAQVAWSESTNGGASYQLYSLRWNPTGNTLTTPVRVSPAGVNASEPTLGLDGQGNALLGWTQGATATSGAPDLYVATYTAFSGWQTSPGFALTGTIGVGAPRLSMNAAGSAGLAWQQLDGTAWRIYGSIFVPGTGWTTAAALSATGGDCFPPDVSTGTDGQVIVAWGQKDAAGLRHVRANRYK